MTLSFLSSHYIQSARFGSLSPYIKSYLSLVLNKGYKPTTIVRQLRLIARLNRWLLRKNCGLGGLTSSFWSTFKSASRRNGGQRQVAPGSPCSDSLVCFVTQRSPHRQRAHRFSEQRCNV